MIKIKFIDGVEYEAEDARKLIELLKLQDYQEGDFKKNIARRVKLWNGETISFGSDIDFLRQLESAGVIVIEPQL